MGKFAEILGHDKIKEQFQNAIRTDKVSHAYILNGEEGAGKRTLATAFAMTLQCEKKGVEPCMECHSCRQAMSGNHPDIIFIRHEKTGSIGVEDIRRQLNGDIMIKPYSRPYKIYMIPDADKLTTQAQNALLKTIEEPPSYVVVLLLACNASGLLPTILSRCVLLNLKPVEPDKIKKYLMQNYQVPDDQSDISVAFAQGNVGKAVKLASSDHFNELKEEAVQILKHLDEMKIYEIIDGISRIEKFKLEINDYLDILKIWFRDVILFKATQEVDDLIFKEELSYLRKQADKSSYEGIDTILKALEKAKVRLRFNANFELVMELLLLTIKEN